MSKIVRVQTGDYRIITAPGGTITLDSGSASIVEPAGWPGGVIINGDLLVNGITTTIKSETLTVKDNIIDINVYDVPEGTPLPEGVIDGLGRPSTAGIQIDRGNLPDVSFLWDESLTTGDSLTFDPGTFVFVDNTYLIDDPLTLRDALRPIATNAINSANGNLILVVGNDGIVEVDGGIEDNAYERKVLDYDLLNSFFEIVSIERDTGGIVTLQLATPHGLISGSEIYVNCYPYPQLSTGTDDPVEVTVLSSTKISYIKPGVMIPEQTFIAGFAGIIRPVSIRNDNYIPNMKAVADYTASAMTGIVSNKIIQGNSGVTVFDNSIVNQISVEQIVVGTQYTIVFSGTTDFTSIGAANNNVGTVFVATSVGTGTGIVTVQNSQIIFGINSVTQAVITNNGLFVDNIQIDNNTIKNKNSSLDKILFDSVLELKTKPGDPGVSSGYVSLYSKPVPGTGGTGLFFVNTEGTRDELISKTKALLYSLIL